VHHVNNNNNNNNNNINTPGNVYGTVIIPLIAIVLPGHLKSVEQ